MAGLVKTRSFIDRHKAASFLTKSWYVRLFLYSMMCLCFAMVLFWQPGSKDLPKYSAIYEEDDEYAADLHNNRLPAESEVIHAKVIDLMKWTPEKVDNAPNLTCKTVHHLSVEFQICGDTLKPPKTEELKRMETIFKENPKSDNIAGLQEGLKRNSLLSPSLRFINNALSDNFGDSAVRDHLHHKHAAVNAIRATELLSQTDLDTFVLRVRMQGFECFALGADGASILGGRSVVAVVTDGLQSGGNRESCLVRVLRTLTQFGYSPTLTDSTPVIDKLRAGTWDMESLFWVKTK